MRKTEAGPGIVDCSRVEEEPSRVTGKALERRDDGIGPEVGVNNYGTCRLKVLSEIEERAIGDSPDPAHRIGRLFWVSWAWVIKGREAKRHIDVDVLQEPRYSYPQKLDPTIDHALYSLRFDPGRAVNRLTDGNGTHEQRWRELQLFGKTVNLWRGGNTKAALPAGYIRLVKASRGSKLSLG